MIEPARSPLDDPLDDPRELRLHALNLACSIRKQYIDVGGSPAEFAAGILADARAFEAYITGQDLRTDAPRWPIDVGDAVAYMLADRRIQGVVTGVATDGVATAEFPQESGGQPMTIVAPAEALIRIRETREAPPS